MAIKIEFRTNNSNECIVTKDGQLVADHFISRIHLDIIPNDVPKLTIEQYSDSPHNLSGEDIQLVICGKNVTTQRV